MSRRCTRSMQPGRWIMALLLAGLMHVALLSSAGRASVASDRVTQAPIRVRMLPLPAAVPARPHAVAARRSSHEPTSPPARPALEAPEIPRASTATADDTHYLPSAELERAALPRSAPDTRLLDDVVLSGLPLRLRICIDALGHVTQVLALQAHPDDTAAVAALQQMFAATAYVPGRLGGEDVASYIDVELSVGPGSGS